MVRALQDTGLIKRSWFRACWGHYVAFLLVTMPHSIQVYKWVPSYLMFGVTLFLKAGIQKLVFASP